MVNRLFAAYLVAAIALVACATQVTLTHSLSATNTPAVTCMVTASRLNVRSGPGVEYRAIGYLDYGATVRVYNCAASSDGGMWLLVALEPEQWINSDYADCNVPVACVYPPSNER